MELDPSYLILMMTRGEGIHNIIYMIIAFCVMKFGKYIYEYLLNKYIAYKNMKWNKISFEGQEILYSGWKFFNYPKPFLSLCHYAYINNCSNTLKHFIIAKNSHHGWEAVGKTDDVTNFIIDNSYNILIGDDMFIDIYHQNTRKANKKKSNNEEDGDQTTDEIILCLKSKTHTMDSLRKFVDKCTHEFEDYIKKNTFNKIYHFIYSGRSKNNCLQFTSTIINDLSKDSLTCYESFDHIHNEHKEKIIGDIKRLKDIKYYKKYGLKRKKGYLFYGYPGCGKTYTVMAISNYDKRHIIEIPMSRIKTNQDFEDILALEQIHGIKFTKSQIILLFDEIDTGGKVLDKRDGEKTEIKKEDAVKIESGSLIETLLKRDVDKSSKNNDTDKLNLGTVLSRIDGIGNYDGLIIIATTNCRDKLSPALYRHGRLDPVFFNYCRKVDVQHIIEEYYEVKLTQDQIDKLPDETHKIVASSVIKYIEDYSDNLEELIKFFEDLCKKIT